MNYEIRVRIFQIISDRLTNSGQTLYRSLSHQFKSIYYERYNSGMNFSCPAMSASIINCKFHLSPFARFWNEDEIFPLLQLFTKLDKDRIENVRANVCHSSQRLPWIIYEKYVLNSKSICLNPSNSPLEMDRLLSIELLRSTQNQTFQSSAIHRLIIIPWISSTDFQAGFIPSQPLRPQSTQVPHS